MRLLLRGIILILLLFFGEVPNAIAKEEVEELKVEAVELVWHTKLPVAKAKAETELKNIFVVFGAAYCPWCKKLKEEVLVNPEIRDLLSNFVLLEIDVEVEKALAYLYQVVGLPQVMVMNGSGRPLVSKAGFTDKAILLQMLQSALDPGAIKADTPFLTKDAIEKLLKSGDDEIPWDEILKDLGNPRLRNKVRDQLLTLSEFPKKQMVQLLQDSRLEIRLAALEMLEEFTGDSFGFDPWKTEMDSEQGKAFDSWGKWALNVEQKPQVQRFATYTLDQLSLYLMDLVGENQQRSLRAANILEKGGATTIELLDNYLEENSELEYNLVRRINEVRYSIILSDTGLAQPATLAHRLTFGNLDMQISAIRDIGKLGRIAIPIVKDYLTSEESMIREAAVVALLSGAKLDGVPSVEAHLKGERNVEVIISAIRELGSIKSKKGLALLVDYLSHENEDIVIFSLEGVAKLEARSVSAKLVAKLQDPRWRVRVAALKVVRDLGLLDQEGVILKMIDDPDEFVRNQAFLTLSRIGGDKTFERFNELFKTDESLRGLIIRAYGSKNKVLPREFRSILDVKDPERIVEIVHALGGTTDKGKRYLKKFVQYKNSDVKASALQHIAGNHIGDPVYRAILVNTLKSGSSEMQRVVFKNLDIPYEFSVPVDVDPDESVVEKVNELERIGEKRIENIVSSFMGTFEGSGGLESSVDENDFVEEKATIVELRDAFLSLMYESEDESVRLDAALLACKLGSRAATKYLIGSLDSLPKKYREQLAQVFYIRAFDYYLPLAWKLLRDEGAEVRESAIRGVLNHSKKKEWLDLYFEALLSKESPFLLDEVYGYSVRSAAEEEGILRFRKEALNILQDPGFSRLHVLGLVFLEFSYRGNDIEVVEPFLRAENVYVRRAAWNLLARKDKLRFMNRVEVLLDEGEFLLLDVVAAYFNFLRTNWTIYFDKETVDDRYYYNSRYNYKIPKEGRIDKKTIELLEKLAKKENQKIAFDAKIALILFGGKVDANEMYEAFKRFPKDSRFHDNMRSLVGEHYASLDRDFAVFLPVLENGYYSKQQLLQIKKHFGIIEKESQDLLIEKPRNNYVSSGESEGFLSRFFSGLAKFAEKGKVAEKNVAVEAVQEEGTKKDGESIVVESVPVVEEVESEAGLLANEVEEATVPISSVEVGIVFFNNPGCDECERVKKLIHSLGKEFSSLKVETMDINKSDSLLLNESLSERFNVPPDKRGIAPAIFGFAGYLIKDDIQYERLRGLIQESMEAPIEELVTLESREAEASQERIQNKFDSLTLGIILTAGLLDGINPCAFATIIFFISYLHVARRKPREIIQVGFSFTFGIFLAYLGAGFGLSKVIGQFSGLSIASTLLNVTFAVLAFVVMLLSIRDGFLCLQGKSGSMSLQLPRFLKLRINKVIREGSKQRHFVVAAFFTGIIVSFLELACTGQVYAPIIVMLQDTENRDLASVYLLLYNLTFVLPLIVVIILAYLGMSHEGLNRFFKKHVATVKFATAFLFLLIFLYFVWRLVV